MAGHAHRSRAKKKPRERDERAGSLWDDFE